MIITLPTLYIYIYPYLCSVLQLQRETNSLREQLSVTEEDLTKQKTDYTKLELEFQQQLVEVNEAAEKAVHSAVKHTIGVDKWGKTNYMTNEALKTPGSVRQMGHFGESVDPYPTDSTSPGASGSPSVLREHMNNNPNSNTSTKLISIYQEKLAHVDTINAELRGILETMRSAEKSGTDRETRLQEKCNQYEMNINEMGNKLNNSVVDQEQLIGKLADLEIVVGRYRDGGGNGGNVKGGSGGHSSNDYAIDMDMNDAHAWWGYVFHECRKEQREDQKALEDIVMSGPGATGGVHTQVGITSGVATTTVGAATAFNRLTGEDQVQRTDTLLGMGGGVQDGVGAEVDQHPGGNTNTGISNIEKLQHRISGQRVDLRNQAVELATVRQVCLCCTLCVV